MGFIALFMVRGDFTAQTSKFKDKIGGGHSFNP
jgi:hypothetical protein